MSTDPEAVEAARQPHERLLELAATDAQLRELVPSEDVWTAIKRPGLSDFDIVATVLVGYAARPALGQRGAELATDPATGRRLRRYFPEFVTITYGELRRRVESLASAWRHLPRHRVAPRDFVCIFGFTGIDFVVAELACIYARAVTVPLQPNLPEAALDQILQDTGPATLMSGIDHLELVVRLALRARTVRSIVVFDHDEFDDDDRLRLQAAEESLTRAASTIELTSMSRLVALGAEFRWLPPLPAAEGEERMSALIYTSGSTGSPKGAIYTERISKYPWTATAKPVPVVTLGYAPLSHLHGRIGLFRVLSQGGTVFFTLRNDMTTLFEDIRLVRPTSFAFIPRIADSIYQHYRSELIRRTQDRPRETPEEIARSVMREMRGSFLGDRLRIATGGTAPTAPEVKAFLRECFEIEFAEGFGSTEAGGPIAYEDRIQSHIVTDYKLCDVPELGYHASDRPYPRGELLIRSKLQVPGYYKNPQLTAALHDPDGYQRTGDIFEERGPGHIVWIDRRNNVLKLAQGEYVAIGALETVYQSATPLVRQIYLYGSSYRSYLLAVVVPDLALATGMLGRAPSDAELRTLIRNGLQETARAANLRNFEMPRDFIVEPEPFSYENGLLSSVRKPLRPNLRNRYGARLEAMYVAKDEHRQDDLTTLKDAGSTLTILERVGRALESFLGISGIDPAAPQSFADLGGDSFGAVSFSLLLEELFDVPVPVGAIMSPAGNARQWARLIERALARDGESSSASFTDVHGSEARVLHSKSLVLEQFLGVADRQQAAQAAASAAGSGSAPSAAAGTDGAANQTVLLTGACGYLGRFLCLEGLERAANSGGRVICLIRAPDPRAARQRLDAAFGNADSALTERFRTLADRHLEVMNGELTEPRLGLGSRSYDRLVDRVDRIVHAAALVNHRLSYRNLFEPNVLGTAELLRLALARRQKHFDFISSIAVARISGAAGPADEAADVRASPESVTLSEQYASGYAASKWAGEVLLRDAHEKFGLPVTVFRADMILAHRRYRGQINLPDMFSRLLYSVIRTGLAPDSFYAGESGAGPRPRAHYDGLPVDFVAAAIAELGARAGAGFSTYNVVNPHTDDGISLDRIMDWIASAGYRLQRIPDHARWFESFGSRLAALPEPERQHSAIAILDAFAEPYRAQPAAIPSAHFVRAVRDLRAGPEVPHLSEAFIHKCLDDLIRLLPAGIPLDRPTMA